MLAVPMCQGGRRSLGQTSCFQRGGDAWLPLMVHRWQRSSPAPHCTLGSSSFTARSWKCRQDANRRKNCHGYLGLWTRGEPGGC